MGRMVRKQLYIDDEQDAALKAEAERLGVTQAEVVREAISAWLDEARARTRDEAWADLLKTWAEIDAQAAACTEPREPYKFRREDAYEDRMKRYDR